MKTADHVTSKHILFVGFPAYGHLIPLLELAKKTTKYHNVTFAVSAFRVADLKKRELISDVENCVTFYGIQDGVTDLFDTREDPKSASHLVQAIFSSFAELMRTIPTAREPTRSVVLKPVDVIIVNSMFCAPVSTGIPYYLFNSGNGIYWRVILSLTDDTPTVAEKDAPFRRLPEPGQPAKPVQVIEKIMFLPVKKAVHLVTGVITNSLLDIELDSSAEIAKHPSMAGLTHHFVGPLLSEEKGTSSVHQKTEMKVKEWLGGKTINSVIYVSFGSFVVTPSNEQITVIGEALLALEQPFIWSIKEKQHKFLPEKLREGITRQFDAEGGQFLALSWAPQKLILEHTSVGVFFSHGGWNSALEGLSNGKAFVVYPLFADQLDNGLWIAKLGAGQLIPDTRANGGRIVRAEELIKALSKVGGWMEEEPGKSTYQVVAEVWKNKLRNAWTPSGSSYKEFMRFVQL